jgi:hypothetical protein
VVDASFASLEESPPHRFSDWPNPQVPQVAAGVYTIWQNDRLIYVGMSGRSLTSEHITTHRAEGARGKGLFSRLSSHASGRRSGDQFCFYVADRLVLPHLTAEQIAEIGAGRLAFDGLVRRYIHEELSYRFVEAPDGQTARAWEAAIRVGGLKAGAPLLNPLQRSGPAAAT